MLKAFFNQLRHLAADPDDLFHVNIKKRIGEKATAEFEADIKEAILMLPDIVARVSVLWSKLNEHTYVKDVGRYFVTYMYNPKDFIPESETNGLFGYLDDIYLANLVYDLLLEELKNTGDAFSTEDERLHAKLLGVKEKVELVIPEETAKIKNLVRQIMEGGDADSSQLFDDS